MLDFICMGSADLFGTEMERKFKMKIYVSSGIRTHATPLVPMEECSILAYDVLSHNLYDTPGLAPYINVKYQGQRDFRISVSNRDTVELFIFVGPNFRGFLKLSIFVRT